MYSFGRRNRGRKRTSRKVRSRSRSRSNRKNRHSRRSRKFKKPKGMTCRDFLSSKIRDNMREFKNKKRLSNGRIITSRKQAIAIAYQEVRNAGCKI
jgi:hypothetical protein